MQFFSWQGCKINPLYIVKLIFGHFYSLALCVLLFDNHIVRIPRKNLRLLGFLVNGPLFVVPVAWVALQTETSSRTHVDIICQLLPMLNLKRITVFCASNGISTFTLNGNGFSHKADFPSLIFLPHDVAY